MILKLFSGTMWRDGRHAGGVWFMSDSSPQIGFTTDTVYLPGRLNSLDGIEQCDRFGLVEGSERYISGEFFCNAINILNSDVLATPPPIGWRRT